MAVGRERLEQKVVTYKPDEIVGLLAGWPAGRAAASYGNLMKNLASLLAKRPPVSHFDGQS